MGINVINAPDYHDVTINAQVECRSAEDALALANAMKDLIRRYGRVDVQLTVSSEDFPKGGVPQLVQPAIRVVGGCDQAASLNPVQGKSHIHGRYLSAEYRRPA